jgi:DNA polymerase elongation subunit (family B)/intein/homing endonuclease
MAEKNIDISVVTTHTFATHKLFKKILRQNNFEKINHNIIHPEKGLEKIESYKPKLIVLIGEETFNLFNLNKDINQLAGKIFQLKDKAYNVFTTYSLEGVTNELDPMFSFVNNHIKKISESYFKNREKEENKIKLNPERCLDKCYSYKLPDWCYDENHILIDIQNNKFEDKLVFVFRDNNGKKKYHFENSKKRYFYVNPIEIKNSEIIKDVKETEIHFKQQGLLDNVAIYEGDVAQELKHSIDYAYTRTKPELKYELKKLFWDIEVYTGDHVGFPFPLEAEFPINSISFTLDLNNDVYVYILKAPGMDLMSYTDHIIDYNTSTKEFEDRLNKHTEISDHYKLRVFETEEELISEFLNKAKQLDPDIWAGWNTENFDVPYLVNRMHKLGMSLDTLSPINEADVDISSYYGTTVYGLYFVDQLFLYKKLSQNVEESYKLSSISQKVLGEDKVAYEGTINDMYEKDLVRFIRYSGMDTVLLAELENALSHINLNFELIKTCCSTWKRSETTSGLCDPLLLKFAKDRNKVCRNRVYNSMEVFSGAYVLFPKTGIHKWVVDFDFASLYPSIIRSLNLGPNTYMAKISESIANLYLYDFDLLPKEIDVVINPILKNSNIVKMSPTQLKDFIEKNNYIISINGCMLKQHDVELSFFYEVLEYLGNMRNLYKKKLGDLRQQINTDTSLSPEEKSLLTVEMKQYDNKQSTVKVIANSIYGIISMPYFRMFNIDIAKAITGTGQEALKFSILHLSNYMKNDETDININFLKDFKRSDLPYIAYGDSVGKDSIINLEYENKTIEEMWNESNSEIVHSNDGKERKIINKKVLSSIDDKSNKFLICTSIVRHKVSKKIYRIELSNQTYIDVTEDHSLITLDDDLNYKETKPEDSKYILLNRYIPRNKNQIKTKGYLKEVYELFGFWMGDGSYNSLIKNDYICISSGIDTKEFCEKILEPLKNNNIISNYYVSKNGYDLKILSKSFTLLMKDLNFCGISRTKRIPEWIFNETEENIYSFLRGYFSSDGTGKSNNLLLSSINKDMLKDVQILLKYCKISSRLLKGNTGNTYITDKITSYSYQLKVYDELEFYNKIGFIFSRKGSRPNNTKIIVKKDLRDRYRKIKKMPQHLSEFVSLDKIKLFENNLNDVSTINFDISPRRINKIYEIEYNDYVYDLTVPETQKFFANDILVHNTDSMFVMLGDYLADNNLI